MSVWRSKLEPIIELANEGIWTLDSDDRTDFMNKSRAAILGYTPGKMIGCSMMEFLPPGEVGSGI